MRTIVAFLLTAILCAAQSLSQIDVLEKQIADHPDNIAHRVNLLRMLANRQVALPPEKVRELRQQHILWLIEHHPDAPNIFEDPNVQLRGRLADPAGLAEAEGLWKELAGKSDAKPAVIANAATYLSVGDPASALALLDKYQDDPILSRARGYVDAAAMLGLSGLGQNSQFSTSAASRNSPEAKAARREIEASANPYLVGKAGMVLSVSRIENPLDLAFGDDDPPTLGERWLRRAIELAPPGTEWKPTLGQGLRAKANRTLDPMEKVRLLTEALSLFEDNAKAGILQNLATAEFDSGDDLSAERDANLLLASAPKSAYAYNVAQTVLGRIAVAKGDLNKAKTTLIASITMPASLKNALIDPNMALAQDIYDAGDKAAVIEFLEASRTVWKFDRGRIDRMISFVKKASSADLVQLARQFPGNEILRRPAPAFEATDSDGNLVTREQLAGKVVALEFGKAPLAERVSKDFTARGAVLLRIQDDDIKRRFEVLTDPTLVVIDRQGNVSGYRSGPGTEADWRNEFESGFGRGPNLLTLPAPKQIDGKIAWEPVDSAESYIVEWDSRDETGWIFDHDHTVRVIATRDTSAMLDLTGFTRVRWRVYAVPKFGQPGAVSPWQEIEGTPVTKIYK